MGLAPHILVAVVPDQRQDHRRAISQFTHTAWTAKDGIPGPVRAIAQTQDLDLWLGTEAGLYRFDGLLFALWQPAPGEGLPGVSVLALHRAEDDTLDWLRNWRRVPALRGPSDELSAGGRCFPTRNSVDRVRSFWNCLDSRSIRV